MNRGARKRSRLSADDTLLAETENPRSVAPPRPGGHSCPGGPCDADRVHVLCNQERPSAHIMRQLGPRVCGLSAGAKRIRTAGPTYDDNFQSIRLNRNLLRSEGDQRLESASLQQRVRRELDFPRSLPGLLCFLRLVAHGQMEAPLTARVKTR